MKASDKNIFEANEKLKLIDDEKLRQIITPEALLKLGYSIDDIIS